MRVRFAPSPTGFLHIGNARTAIANYLIAKKNGAVFVLRVEDTDSERSTKESEISILNDLKWLGLDWDEGPDKGGNYGPYRQSERYDIYKKYSEKLLQEGKAYKCYCTREELDNLRKEAEEQNHQNIMPDKCRNLSEKEKIKFEKEGKPYTIRFRVPDGETITIKDNIKGTVTFSSENIGGDFIIVRSDGSPVYNYIVIIDDTLMNITHVIRGEDHLSNTPKQILIARALNLPIPEYAHLALVLGSDRSKLSKRHGITSVDMYRKEGYLPEALLNYIAMLGWATESGDEILSIDEIASQIDLNNLAKSAAVFDFQKLKWMNGNYIRNYPLEKIIQLFIPYIKEAGYSIDSMDKNLLEKIISIARMYCELLSDIKNIIGIFLDEICLPDEETDKFLQEEDSKKIIESAYALIQSDINKDNYSQSIVTMIKEKTGLKGKKLFWPIRGILTGRLKGPELDVALPLIGFEKCKKRIEFYYKKYCS